MTPLRIAIDVTPIHPGGANGGAKRFVLDLIEGLARRGPHRYLLLTAAHNHDELASFEAVDVERMDVTGRSAPLGLPDAGIDLLFCPMTAPTYAETGIPTVSTLYDLQHVTYPWFFSADELAHRVAFYRELVARVDHVVCISEFSRQAALTHLSLAAERASTVHIALHHRLAPVPAAAAWAALGRHTLPPCRFAFYPANFWPHKNHRLLVTAFARFCHDHPDVPLHLVLTGEPLGEAATIRTAVERMGLSQRVHLLDYVPDEVMQALWSAGEFLVFPSLYEGFGIPVLEALHLGMPVLCSREGSLPEVAGEDVLYFDARDPGTMVDAFATATRAPDALLARARAGQGRVARLAPDAAVAAYVAVFERVAGARRRPSLARRVRLVMIDRRRALAHTWLDAGRTAFRAGKRTEALARVSQAIALAPEFTPTLIAPLVRQARRVPVMRAWARALETHRWLQGTALHLDGWAGPVLEVEVEIEARAGKAVVRLDATPPPGPPQALTLEAFLDGAPLGAVTIAPAAAIRPAWTAPGAAGRHRLRIVASRFVVPDDLLRNGDTRPLSYRVSAITIAVED